MTNLIRKVMDNLSNLTSAPYTPEQREALAHAQNTVDEAIAFQRDMARLRVLGAKAFDAHIRADHYDPGPSVFDQLVDEIGAPL